MNLALDPGEQIFGSLVRERAHLGVDHAASAIFEVDPPVGVLHTAPAQRIVTESPRWVFLFQLEAAVRSVLL